MCAKRGLIGLCRSSRSEHGRQAGFLAIAADTAECRSGPSTFSVPAVDGVRQGALVAGQVFAGPARFVDAADTTDESRHAGML